MDTKETYQPKLVSLPMYLTNTWGPIAELSHTPKATSVFNEAMLVRGKNYFRHNTSCKPTQHGFSSGNATLLIGQKLRQLSRNRLSRRSSRRLFPNRAV